MTETTIVNALAALGHTAEALDYAKCGSHYGYVVEADQLPAIAHAFANHEYFLEMLTCLDLRQEQQRMRLVYTFNRFGTCERHKFTADLAPTFAWTGPDAPPKKKPRPKKNAEATEQEEAPKPVPAPTRTKGISIASILPAADWFEREVYDMYGVVFEGHPDLKRILLPEDSNFHALLKDFGRIDAAPVETAL